MTPRAGGARVWIGGALLIGLLLAAYHGAFSGSFVFDNASILSDYRLRDARHLPLILFKDYWYGYTPSRLWRPLTTLSYFFNYTILGNGSQPFGYHAVNVALHAINALLLWRVLSRLGLELRLAWLGAASFAVHPIATESVTNIVGRADLLATGAVLVCLLLAMRGRWLLAQLVFLVGLLGKESAVAAPAWIAAWLWLVRDAALPLPERGRRIVRAIAPYLVTLALYLVARAIVLRGIDESYAREDNFLVGLPWAVQRLTAIKVFGLGLGKLIFPLRLSADYSYDQVPAVTTVIDGWLLAGTLALGAAVVVLATRPGLAACGIAWFVLGILPVSNLVFLIGTGMGERLLYLPAIGLVLLGTVALGALDRRGRALVAWPLAALILLLFAVRTEARNRVWQDDLTFWEATVRDAPRSVRALRTYARALLMRDASELEQPIALLEQAVAIAPDEIETRASLTFALAHRADRRLRTGSIAEADVDLRHAAEHAAAGKQFEEHEPRPADAIYSGSAELARGCAVLALARFNLDRVRGGSMALPESAETSLRKAIALVPGYAAYHLELASVLLAMQRPEDAAATLLGMWVLNLPMSGPAGGMLAHAYQSAQLPVAAFFDLDGGVRLRRGDQATPEQRAKHARILQAAFASTIQLLRAGGHAAEAQQKLAAAQRSGLATALVRAAAVAPLPADRPWTCYADVP